jgi:hypothetical protein
VPFGYSRMVTETVGDRAALGDAVPFLNAIEPELVVPAVSFLASRVCTFTHRAYSASGGRFARVFVGLGEGWTGERGSVPSAEDLQAHIDEASATERFIVPDCIFDEVADTCSMLGIPL